MNKFAAFTILTLAALAVSAHSFGIEDHDDDEAMTQAVLQTTDDEETAQLAAKNLQAFGDFCISSRDYVLADVKRQSNEMGSKVFNMFFSSAAEIGRESLEVQQQATEKLAAQLANPQAAIEGATGGVDEIIANGQAKIQGESQPNALLTAFKSAVSAVSSKVGGLVTQRLQYLKSLANPGQVLYALNHGCDQIADYEKELSSQFATYKQESLGADAEKYAKLTLDAVPCATSMKIIRSEGLCGLFRVAAQPIKKIIGQ